MRPRLTALSLVICFFLAAAPARGWDPQLHADSFLLRKDGAAEVIGAHRPYTIGEKETLVELARMALVGYEALRKANPGVDPWLPRPGRTVLLPYSTVIPPGAGPGITVNLAEFRLYYIWREESRYRVRTYPVGIGRQGWETPEGRFAIACKLRDPSWLVPPSIRRERPELPAVVPSGRPDNPLGGYWLGLGKSGYGIHGTSEPFGVGRRVSHGCLRLYPEDIQDLFDRIGVGTPVRIIYQPVKVGLRDRALFVEIHPDFLGRLPDPSAELDRHLRELDWKGGIDRKTLLEEIDRPSGIPVRVSRN